MFARIPLVLLLVTACKGSQAGNPDGSRPPEGRACTEEAKVCPDGSAVGRTGPDCAFAACPAGADAAAGPPAGVAGGTAPATIRECTAPAGCTEPRMLAPNTLCPDGKTMSGPVCADAGDATCAWQMRECPT